MSIPGVVVFEGTGTLANAEVPAPEVLSEPELTEFELIAKEISDTIAEGSD